jgi:anti-sigma factor NepR-like protein
MTDKRNRADTGTGKDHARPDEPGKRRARNGLDERWLEKKVRDMYQEVVDEPVPDDILKILNRIPKLS